MPAPIRALILSILVAPVGPFVAGIGDDIVPAIFFWIAGSLNMALIWAFTIRAESAQ